MLRIDFHVNWENIGISQTADRICERLHFRLDNLRILLDGQIADHSLVGKKT